MAQDTLKRDNCCTRVHLTLLNVFHFYGQHCARNFCDWSRMCEMVCRFWFVCHFSFAGLSHEISTRWEKCPAVDQSGCEHSRLQEANFPDHCQCFDAKTITATLVSTPTISEFPWILRRVDLQFHQSSADPSSRVFGISTVAPAPNHDPEWKEFSDCAVISSTTAALSASARGSPMCNGCQKVSRACRSANCVSEAVIDYLCNRRCRETLVSEIVRPSPEAAQLLNVSAPVAARGKPEFALILLETW